MNLKEIALLFASIILSISGQFCFKAGAIKLGKVTGDNLFNHLINFLSTPELFLGFFSYGGGAITYILLLTRVKLSIAGPSASLIYLFTVLIGHFVFHENIPVERAIGLFFITLGVTLVLWKY